MIDLDELVESRFAVGFVLLQSKDLVWRGAPLSLGRHGPVVCSTMNIIFAITAYGGIFSRRVVRALLVSCARPAPA